MQNLDAAVIHCLRSTAAVDSNDPMPWQCLSETAGRIQQSCICMKGNLALNKEVTAGWTDGNTGYPPSIRKTTVRCSRWHIGDTNS